MHFPASYFKEDSLKDHLWDSLKDMNSRVDNLKDLMKKLMHTEWQEM